MDWVDRPQNYKGLYGILQHLQGCHLNSFPLKTLKLGWVAFHSSKFQLKCLDFQSNQYKKLAPVLPRLCNWLLNTSLVFTQSIALAGKHLACFSLLSSTDKIAQLGERQTEDLKFPGSNPETSLA